MRTARRAIGLAVAAAILLPAGGASATSTVTRCSGHADPLRLSGCSATFSLTKPTNVMLALEPEPTFAGHLSALLYRNSDTAPAVSLEGTYAGGVQVTPEGVRDISWSPHVPKPPTSGKITVRLGEGKWRLVVWAYDGVHPPSVPPLPAVCLGRWCLGGYGGTGRDPITFGAHGPFAGSVRSN